MLITKYLILAPDIDIFGTAFTKEDVGIILLTQDIIIVLSFALSLMVLNYLQKLDNREIRGTVISVSDYAI